MDIAERDAARQRSTGEFTRELPQGTRRETVFVATTRAPGDPKSDIFSGVRARRAHFLTHAVSIPANVEEASLSTAGDGGTADPARHFVIASQTPVSDARAFASQIAGALRPGQRVAVFVHGYNNSYRDALLQMLKLNGRGEGGFLPVLFSFASQGAVTGYGYDKDSVLVARPFLADVLDNLTRIAPGRIDIAAHSMGTWLTVEALQLAALRQGAASRGRIGALLLASPDIDAELMDVIWPLVKGTASRTLVLCHEGDKALRASSLVGGGGQRVGSLPDCAKSISARYAGIETINAAEFSETQRDRFLHNPGTNNALIDRVISMAPR
jgi:esterase/lipase superfamily enzyme